MRVCTVDSIQGTLACHPLFFLTPIPLTPPAFQRNSPSHFSLYLLGCLETPVAHQHPAPSDTSLMKKTPCTPSLPLATDVFTMTTPPNVYLSKINPHQVSLTTPMRHDPFIHSIILRECSAFAPVHIPRATKKNSLRRVGSGYMCLGKGG